MLVAKKLPANAGGAGNKGLSPGLGRSSGGVDWRILQYSYLENPMDIEASWSTVRRISESCT